MSSPVETMPNTTTSTGEGGFNDEVPLVVSTVEEVIIGVTIVVIQSKHCLLNMGYL